jgi:hypothetical protein
MHPLAIMLNTRLMSHQVYPYVRWSSLERSHQLFRASQFLSEELPIRLAHRVQELNDLPDGLNEMPSICRVRDWYAQSFEVHNASLA